MNTHYDEICRLAKAPNDTQIWRYGNSKKWILSVAVVWSGDTLYVVADGIHEEERKAFALGEKIQYFHSIKGWTDANNPYWNATASRFRVKPKEWYENIKEPILCWVSDIDKSIKERAVYILMYDGEHFLTKDRIPWKYATRVSTADLTQEIK